MPPATAQDYMVIDGNVASDLRQREELTLLKTFLGIADPLKRQRIIELAERLADDAPPEAGRHGFASTDAALGEVFEGDPAQTE